MTRLDDALTRLARRLTVARLGLAQGGPRELLESLLGPVQDSIEDVVDLLHHTEQPTFAPITEPVGPATTDVLADIVSPRPKPEED